MEDRSMPEYRVTFVGPRRGKDTVVVFAPRACDALEEAKARMPGMNGRPVDVCRTWTKGVDDAKCLPGFHLIRRPRPEKGDKV